MNSVKKKLLATILVLGFLMSLVPAKVAEATPTYQNEVTFVMYEKNQVAGIDLEDLELSDEINKENVSSSDSSVASVFSITRDDQETETEIIDPDEVSDDLNSYTYTIDLKLKKAGSTVVTVKVGAESYDIKVNVVKYKNPIKTLKIKGINRGKNIASKTKKKNYVNFTGVKVKSGTLKITPKSGWTVERISFSCNNTGITMTQKNRVKKNGETQTVKVKSMSLGSLKKSYTYIINITLVNKAGVRENVNYCISKSIKLQGVY